jgi:probable F420-dependent oxidoreductase
VLVAKQSATLDVLSGGRLRLGVGVGWNPIEAEAMGTDFHTRGKRIEEQIVLLRKLWTEPLVDFEGQWHRVSGAGINPLPIQRPIPIWAGATADAALRRAARLADGWFPLVPPDQRSRDLVAKMRGYLQAAGRDPNAFGIEARAYLKEWDPDRLHQQVQFWRDLGATHLDVSTMGMGLASAQEHIKMIERLKRELDPKT